MCMVSIYLYRFCAVNFYMWLFRLFLWVAINEKLYVHASRGSKEKVKHVKNERPKSIDYQELYKFKSFHEIYLGLEGIALKAKRNRRTV